MSSCCHTYSFTTVTETHVARRSQHGLLPHTHTHTAKLDSETKMARLLAGSMAIHTQTCQTVWDSVCLLSPSVFCISVSKLVIISEASVTVDEGAERFLQRACVFKTYCRFYFTSFQVSKKGEKTTLTNLFHWHINRIFKTQEKKNTEETHIHTHTHTHVPLLSALPQ